MKVAQQLCVEVTEDKSQGDRMGSVCFKSCCWAQTVTYLRSVHMWAESDSWHVFCMVIMWSTFSHSCWHAESPESQETADDDGLGLGLGGNGADWAAQHRGRGEELCCSTYQQPDAREENPCLSESKLNFTMFRRSYNKDLWEQI